VVFAQASGLLSAPLVLSCNGENIDRGGRLRRAFFGSQLENVEAYPTTAQRIALGKGRPIRSARAFLELVVPRPKCPIRLGQLWGA